MVIVSRPRNRQSLLKLTALAPVVFILLMTVMGVLPGGATTIGATDNGTAVNSSNVTMTPSALPARYIVTYKPGGDAR